MHQTFKQYLVEARYTVRAELKPLVLHGTKAEYQEDERYRRGYSELIRGQYPVIRFYTSHWRDVSWEGTVKRKIPDEKHRVQEYYYTLVDPKPIIVNILNETKMGGKSLKRLSEIEIIEGADQLVNYWTKRPYKGMQKRAKVFREDPNIELGYEQPLSEAIDSKKIYVMTKDLKRS